MRTIIVFFIITVNLFSIEIDFDKNLSLDNRLKNTFIQYWEKRAKKRFDQTYRYEAPFLRYLYTKDWYIKYFLNAPKIKKIVVKSIDCNIDQSICKIKMLIKVKKYFHLYTDRWINVDKIWYHRFNDKPLPLL